MTVKTSDIEFVSLVSRREITGSCFSFRYGGTFHSDGGNLATYSRLLSVL
jgi:hypothetical protein